MVKGSPERRLKALTTGAPTPSRDAQARTGRVLKSTATKPWP